MLIRASEVWAFGRGISGHHRPSVARNRGAGAGMRCLGRSLGTRASASHPPNTEQQLTPDLQGLAGLWRDLAWEKARQLLSRGCALWGKTAN